jgi:hypothetical protein
MNLWRRIRRSRRRLLAEEADRSTRWLQSVVIEAHRLGAIVPDSINASVVVLRIWADYLSRWATEEHEQEDGTIE